MRILTNEVGKSLLFSPEDTWDCWLARHLHPHWPKTGPADTPYPEHSPAIECHEPAQSDRAKFRVYCQGLCALDIAILGIANVCWQIFGVANLSVANLWCSESQSGRILELQCDCLAIGCFWLILWLSLCVWRAIHVPEKNDCTKCSSVHVWMPLSGTPATLIQHLRCDRRNVEYM